MYDKQKGDPSAMIQLESGIVARESCSGAEKKERQGRRRCASGVHAEGGHNHVVIRGQLAGEPAERGRHAVKQRLRVLRRGCVQAVQKRLPAEQASVRVAIRERPVGTEEEKVAGLERDALLMEFDRARGRENSVGSRSSRTTIILL